MAIVLPRLHGIIFLMELHLNIRRVIDSTDSLCDCKGPQWLPGSCDLHGWLGAQSARWRFISLMFWIVVKIWRTSEMIQISVALPNGHAELLTLLPSSTVQDVRTKAQRAFGKKYLRLITAKNRVLVDPDTTLEEAEIEDGECLTALVLQPQLAATRSAFALWCHGAQRNRYLGWCRLWRRQFGSSRSAQECAADSSHWFCLCCDLGRWIRRYLGESLSWRWQFGSSEISSRVCSRFRPHTRLLLRFWKMDLSLPGVMQSWRWQFGSSRSAQGCAADSSHTRPLLPFWKMDPSFGVLCCDSGRWIRRYLGWCDALAVTVRQFEISSRVCNRFKPQVGYMAFAAILEDGSVVTWGDAWGLCRGGDSSAVQDQLKGVQQIQATHSAFAAILEDGSVVTWGWCKTCGGDSSAVQDQLKGVRQIQATEKAFAAILEDGFVVTWGHATYGGDSSAVRDQLKGVQQIQATHSAFAAILEDGSLSWPGVDAASVVVTVRQFKIS